MMFMMEHLPFPEAEWRELGDRGLIYHVRLDPDAPSPKWQHLNETEGRNHSDGTPSSLSSA